MHESERAISLIALSILLLGQSAPQRGLVYHPASGQTTRGISPGQMLYTDSHAVVIGIDQYQSLPRLGGAAADAQRVAATLQAMGMTVTTMLDAQATRSRITELLGDQLPAQLGSEDRVLVYFAGHGVSVGDGDQAMGYLMPVEGVREAPRATGISMAELQSWLQEYPSKHVMFVADACYSGLALTRATGLSVELPDYLRRVVQARVQVALVAGMKGEEANEAQGRGLFTDFFLAGIQGAADANADGLVTSDELAAYVKPNVAETAMARFRAQQHPQSARRGEGEFLFVSETEQRGSTPTSSAGLAPPTVVLSAPSGNVSPLADGSMPAGPGMPPLPTGTEPMPLFIPQLRVDSTIPLPAEVLRQLLAALLVGTGRVVEAGSVSPAMFAEVRQRPAQIDDDRTRIGYRSALGARYMVDGEIPGSPASCSITLRLVELETRTSGRIIITSLAPCDVVGLEAGLRQAGSALITPAGGAPGTPGSPSPVLFMPLTVDKRLLPQEKLLRDLLAAELVATGRFVESITGRTEETLWRLLREVNSDTTALTAWVRLGEGQGARLVVGGEIQKTATGCFLTTHFVDLETRTVLRRSATALGGCAGPDLQAEVRRAAGLLAPAGIPAPGPTTVVLYAPLTVGKDFSRQERVLRNALASRMLATNRFVEVTSDTTDQAVVGAVQKVNIEVNKASTWIRVGLGLGATKMVAGSVAGNPRQCLVTVRLIDLQTRISERQFSGSPTPCDDASLLREMERAGARLVGQ